MPRARARGSRAGARSDRRRRRHRRRRGGVRVAAGALLHGLDQGAARGAHGARARARRLSPHGRQRNRDGRSAAHTGCARDPVREGRRGHRHVGRVAAAELHQAAPRGRRVNRNSEGDTMDEANAVTKAPLVDYQTHPQRYRHYKVRYDGPVATLSLDIDENGGIREGYKLKLNSYDLGVDIELADALQRIRFEHPEVRAVVLTSAKDRVFCSGANIFMLGLSSHAWKVNFCKFTNETRNGIEDASRHSGLKFLAACNGTTAGGGYELALACDEILLVDDRSAAVSLPEVPLLGVLPGTGGLTRVTDKRKVRRDLADIFCTTPEGIQGQRAKEWKLVDDVVKPTEWNAAIQKRAQELAAKSDRPNGEKGITLTPIQRKS